MSNLKSNSAAYLVLLSCAVLALGCQPTGQARTDTPPTGAPPPPQPVASAHPVVATLVIPEGTPLPLELRTSLSSASNHAGDVVVAVLREDLRGDGRVLAPAGSELRGRVTTAVRSGKVKGRGRLVVRFDELELRGRTHALKATAVDISAKSSKKRDAALIGGGAGAGALIGGLADGKKGLGLGALIGGAAGGGTVLMTRGHEVELPAGTHVTVRLREPLTV